MEKYFFERHNILKASIVNSLDFPYHLHSEIEIAGVISGGGKAYLNGEEYKLSPGDFFIALPNQLHKYSQFGNGEYYLVIVPQTLVKGISGKLKNISLESPVIKDSKNEISSILNLLIENRRDCKEISIESYITLAVSRMIDKCKEKLIKEKDSNLIKIINYCQENFESDISIDKIAEEFDLSPGYISHIFSIRLKINFRLFINSLRIEKAKELINEGDMNITEIAFAVGFASLRTFNRAFYQLTQKTPREYKKYSAAK